MPHDHDHPGPHSHDHGADEHLHPHAQGHRLAPPHPDPYLPAAHPGPKSAAVAAPSPGHDAAHTHGHAHDDHSAPHGQGPASVPQAHKATAPRYAKVYVITCSDSRTEATDEGGRILRARLADLGHVHAGSAIIRDEAPRILAELERARAAGAQVVLITGGTGLSKRDATFEAIQAVIARPIPGFGELFRMLSFAEIGAAAMLSRATAGVTADGLLLFAMPGSPAAVRLACDRLILPELLHGLGELAR